jgi:hypothetical protein
MTSNEKSDSTALVKARTSAVAKGHSPLVRRGLEDLIRLNRRIVPRADRHRTVTILYADLGMDCFHEFVTDALADSCDIVPVWAIFEREIRLLWTQREFDCAILVLNNIIVDGKPDWPERRGSVLSLIQWLHDHGSSTIIAVSGPNLGLEEEARSNGADGFFDVPVPLLRFEKLLRDRFAPAENGVSEVPGKFAS